METRELRELDARIARLHRRLRDADMTAVEVQAALDRRLSKRQVLVADAYRRRLPRSCRGYYPTRRS